jgi:hypothetical protein
MRRRACARAWRRSTPATRNWPPLAGRRPQSMRKVVVLPAPLGPSRPKISPRRTEKLVLATATKSPKRRTRSFTSMTTSPGSPLAGVVGATDALFGADACCVRSSVMKPSSSRGGTGSACAPASSVASAASSVSGRRMKCTWPPCGTASTMSCCASSRRACIRRGGSPCGGAAMKHRPSAWSRISAGVPSASSLPSRSTNTWLQRSASSR